MLRFFVDVCGTFPDSQFLHYNLPRTKRVLSGVHYARLIAEVPNLVATKNTAGGVTGAEDLLRHSSELMHFMGEGNFPHGAMFGSVGLLATMAELAPIRCRELFEAGQKRDLVPLFTIQHQFARLEAELWAVGSSAPHMDGAYDKMLTKLGMLPDFPLRLLSPYTSFEESDYLAMKQVLDDGLARLDSIDSAPRLGASVRSSGAASPRTQKSGRVSPCMRLATYAATGMRNQAGRP